MLTCGQCFACQRFTYFSTRVFRPFAASRRLTATVARRSPRFRIPVRGDGAFDEPLARKVRGDRGTMRGAVAQVGGRTQSLCASSHPAMPATHAFGAQDPRALELDCARSERGPRDRCPDSGSRPRGSRARRDFVVAVSARARHLLPDETTAGDARTRSLRTGSSGSRARTSAARVVALTACASCARVYAAVRVWTPRRPGARPAATGAGPPVLASSGARFKPHLPSAPPECSELITTSSV